MGKQRKVVVPKGIKGYNLRDVARQHAVCNVVVDAEFCREIDDCKACVFHISHIDDFLNMEKDDGTISING